MIPSSSSNQGISSFFQNLFTAKLQKWLIIPKLLKRKSITLNQYKLNTFLSRVGLETGLPNWQLEPLRSLYILCIFRVLYTPSSLSDITKPRNLGVSGSEKSLLERISMFFFCFKIKFWNSFLVLYHNETFHWNVNNTLFYRLSLTDFFCNWAQLRGELVNRKRFKVTLEYKSNLWFNECIM